MRRMASAGVLSLLLLSVFGALGLAAQAQPLRNQDHAQHAKPRPQKRSQQRGPAAHSRQPQAAKARQRQPANQGQRSAPRQDRQARPTPQQSQQPGRQMQRQNRPQRRAQSAPASRRRGPVAQRQGFRGRQRQRPEIRLARRNDRRIPDQHYRRYFGDQHRFRMGGLRMRGGYSAFQGGGYWFGFLQPWPGDWYDTDQFYIQYTGGGYIMCDWDHRGPCVSVVVLP